MRSIKILIQKAEKYRLIIIVLVIIFGFIFYRTYDKYKFKKFKLHGAYTVTYVYENKITGRTGGCMAYYYYYLNNIKYYDKRPTKQVCNLENNFCIVYYIPDDPDDSMLDFNQVIPPDSVSTYFPKGENPFVREVQEAKELRGN